MESAIVSVIFFAASFVSTVASVVLSFQQDVKWAVAAGAVAIILACLGMIFVLNDMKKERKKDDE